MSEIPQAEKDINARFVEVYNYVKSLRLVKGKSDFCESVGMPREYFSKIEKNKMTIPGPSLSELKKKYNISSNWLLKGQKPMVYNDDVIAQYKTADTINQRVKILRKELNLKQEYITENLNIPRSALSKIENEKQEVPQSLIMFYIRNFGVSPEWLLEGEGDIFKKNNAVLQHKVSLLDTQVTKLSFSSEPNVGERNLGEFRHSVKFRVAPITEVENNNLAPLHHFLLHFEVVIKKINTQEEFFRMECYSLFYSYDKVRDSFISSYSGKLAMAAIAFPYVRAIVSNIVVNSGYNPLILPSFDFSRVSYDDDIFDENYIGEMRNDYTVEELLKQYQQITNRTPGDKTRDQ